MNPIVVLDAGHGGKDPGGLSGSRLEKDDTLRLALAVEKVLEKSDVQVLQTRNSDQAVSLEQRSALANKAGAALFVSLHRNSFSHPQAHGNEVWIYPGCPETTRQFAQNIHQALCRVGTTADRGVKEGNYHVLRETHMPAILVELGFISNSEDNSLFDLHLTAYAKTIAEEICRYFSLETALPEKEQLLYRVQAGAFANKSNALNMQRLLQEKGFPSIVVQDVKPS
ncbi:N-acetylmuramoyl-L-alanine amidase [Oscillospiraceae bacterium MB08-C2-2]|nr:N-acetylmuramoyl-L-alanine amidase [Oscillospiraceae bacterium MB08-C2-2]